RPRSDRQRSKRVRRKAELLRPALLRARGRRWPGDRYGMAGVSPSRPGADAPPDAPTCNLRRPKSFRAHSDESQRLHVLFDRAGAGMTKGGLADNESAPRVGGADILVFLKSWQTGMSAPLV